MADGYNFIPQKKWEQTPTGYYIVPIDQLDIKRTRTDKDGTATIVRCTCPDCSDSRKRSHRDQACVRLDMNTGLGKCYNCGFHFIISTKVKALSKHQPVKKENWKQPRTDQLKPLDAVAIDYLMKRGIQPQTAKKAGVCSARHIVGGMERDCLAFTFREGTKIVNIQYKTTSKQFAMENDCEIIPWNVDACIGQESIIITEGMMDALALMELGYDNVISVSNGADTELRTFNRFRYSHFDSLKTIYLAGDMDEAGEQLRTKLAEYFGEARCRTVEWRIEQEDGESFAEKDANDMLTAHGADAVMQCINHAQPCPITGVETVANYREKLFDIWQNGIQPGKKVGWGEFDDLVQFEPGRSTIIVGEPNTGKSTFADDLVLNLALLHNWKAAIYSPEMFPPERHIARLATTIAGRQFRKEKVTTQRGVDYRQTAIPQPMAERIVDWLEENIFFVTEEKGRTIHKLLHRAEQLQQRYGIQQLLLDPFNYIQLPDGAKSDTMKIGDVLAEIELFAHRKGLFVIVVVHPSKPQKGEQIESLYNASGSAEFRNRADYGLVLVNDDNANRSQGSPLQLHLLKVIVDKVRDDAMGHKGICHLSFDAENYRHGAVRTEHLTDQLNQYRVLPVSSHCWLDRSEQQQLAFEAPDPEDEMPF